MMRRIFRKIYIVLLVFSVVFVVTSCNIQLQKQEYNNNEKIQIDVENKYTNIYSLVYNVEEIEIFLRRHYINIENYFKKFEKDIFAKSAILVSADTDFVLYEKDADTKRHPASITKLLTSLIVLDKLNIDDEIKIGDEIKKVTFDSSKCGIDYGEKISVDKLLKGLLIPSGNDAAYAFASYIGGINRSNKDIDQNINRFVDLMNEYLIKFKMNDTHFSNPDGYYNENHYTTARDLVKLTKKAMNYNKLKEVMSIEKYEMDDYKQYRKKDSKIRTWRNTNELINKESKYYNQYVVGAKTGYTKEAGYCLSTMILFNNRPYICVVLNSTRDGRFEDTNKLIDFLVNY